MANKKKPKKKLPEPVRRPMDFLDSIAPAAAKFNKAGRPDKGCKERALTASPSGIRHPVTQLGHLIPDAQGPNYHLKQHSERHRTGKCCRCCIAHIFLESINTTMVSDWRITACFRRQSPSFSQQKPLDGLKPVMRLKQGNGLFSDCLLLLSIPLNPLGEKILGPGNDFRRARTTVNADNTP